MAHIFNVFLICMISPIKRVSVIAALYISSVSMLFCEDINLGVICPGSVIPLELNIVAQDSIVSVDDLKTSCTCTILNHESIAIKNNTALITLNIHANTTAPAELASQISFKIKTIEKNITTFKYNITGKIEQLFKNLDSVYNWPIMGEEVAQLRIPLVLNEHFRDHTLIESITPDAAGLKINIPKNQKGSDQITKYIEIETSKSVPYGVTSHKIEIKAYALNKKYIPTQIVNIRIEKRCSVAKVLPASMILTKIAKTNSYQGSFRVVFNDSAQRKEPVASTAGTLLNLGDNRYQISLDASYVKNNNHLMVKKITDQEYSIPIYFTN